jgi:hypothetical protein
VSIALAERLDREVREKVLAPLGAVRRRARLYIALDGLQEFATAIVGACLIQFVLDWWLKLPVWQRVGLSVVIVLYWLGVIWWRLIAPLCRPMPDFLLAGLVDRANPGLRDRMSTAVELAGQTNPGRSPKLTQAVLAEACRDSERVDFAAVLNHRAAACHAAELVVLLVLVCVSVRVFPNLAEPWLARNWLMQDVAWPQHTHVWPEGFDVDGRRRMARGDPIEISARVTGRVPDSAVLHWWTPSGRRGREEMSLVADTHLAASIGQLTEPVQFRITGGDERTRIFTVEAVERPRVMHTHARITPPEYTRLEPLEIEQQTVLEVLEGSTLEIDALLNKPVQRARFVAADGVDAPCELTWDDPDAAQAIVRLRWPAPQSGIYHFELLDLDNLTSRNPVSYTLKVAPDAPPTVKMELAGVGEMVTPQAELPVTLSCEDAYGLSAVRLLVQTADGPERGLTPPGFSPEMRKYSGEFVLAMAASGAGREQAVRIRGEARDISPGGANSGTTPVVTLRVVSAEDLLVELARRELGLRQEFERLISAQAAVKDGLERWLAAVGDGGVADATQAQRLTGLVRTQAMHANRCLAVARGFEQILGEMRVNRVAKPADEQRISQRLVNPLGRLARETIPATGDLMAALQEQISQQLGADAKAAQENTLAQMREILENMLEWEGYREAVALLESTIAAQTEVRAATLEAVANQLDDILGDEPVEAPENDNP